METDFSLLPFIFASLMGISILVYVILDGFDLGIGILFPLADHQDQKDRMIASIGPFWDANETWLVLAVGLLLVAFPVAHGIVLTALYLPVFIMLVGLILRGVSFEFRAKADIRHKALWDHAFFTGSLLTALSQGFMLGIYIMGLQYTPATIAFSLLTAFCLAAGYAFIGAGWLILKTDGKLQIKAVKWARTGLVMAVVGMAAISIASPLTSPRIFEKWFSLPQMALLAPLPLAAAAVMTWTWLTLGKLPLPDDRRVWVPFAGAAFLFLMAFTGLAYSFYPYVVPERLTIFEAASAESSLLILLVGAVFVLPMIAGYTALSYYIFRGKTTTLRYD